DVLQVVSRRLQGRGEQALDPFDVLVHISSSSLALPPAEVRRTAATARASARRAASFPPYATASVNGKHPIGLPTASPRQSPCPSGRRRQRRESGSAHGLRPATRRGSRGARARFLAGAAQPPRPHPLRHLPRLR